MCGRWGWSLDVWQVGVVLRCVAGGGVLRCVVGGGGS